MTFRNSGLYHLAALRREQSAALLTVEVVLRKDSAAAPAFLGSCTSSSFAAARVFRRFYSIGSREGVQGSSTKVRVLFFTFHDDFIRIIGDYSK